jgi:hypothetical protein
VISGFKSFSQRSIYFVESMMGITLTAVLTYINGNARPAPLLTTLAGYVIAPSFQLAKTLAFRTLFEIVLLGVLSQGLCTIFSVYFNLIFVGRILSTSKAFVSVESTLNTILTLAERAVELFQVSVVQSEAVSASRFRAPLD